jgi:hypothetical protein
MVMGIVINAKAMTLFDQLDSMKKLIAAITAKNATHADKRRN